MRSDLERILDIKESIGKIEKHSQKGEEAFVSDELVQTW